MKKNLIIIPAFVNSDKLIKNFNKLSDVLALTPSAMLSLDALHIAYKTTEDFYDTEVFRGDLKSLHEKTEKLFSELDKVCENFVDFPYAYTGNIIYFLKMFANLLYLEKLSLKIEETYSKIYLLSNTIPKWLLWSDLTYSDLRSIPQTAGLENKIQILKNLLRVELAPGVLQGSSPVPYHIKAQAFLKRFTVRLGKGVKEKRVPFFGKWHIFNFMNPNKKTLFIIQDGYEVDFLRKHMSEFKFVNPVISLRNTVPSLPSANYDFNQIMFKLKTFLESNFPKLKSLIESLFLSYHREVVGRLTYFRESFEEFVEHHNPKTLLFSVGSRDVIDNVFSYIANQKDIPVIYFQHGGPSIFIKNIFLKYIERDIKTRKTLILNSRVEIEEATHDGSQCIALGSISRYKLIKDSPDSGDNKILYCCGPFPFYNYTSLLFNVTDKHCYQVNRDILEVCKERSLDIDIKLHPVEEDYCFRYFRQLISTAKYTKAQIIYGIPAESIMKSYGLIILDSIVSAVVPHALSLKVPIILYLKDLSIVNALVLEDLRKRCYIVHDREMLSEVLRKYATDNLPSKWSIEIVDRYIYPVKNGHPGPNIANYIKSVCSAEP